MDENNKEFKERMAQRDEVVAKNPILKSFVESGDCIEASKLASMAYMLATIADDYMQEMFELLAKHKLQNHEIQHFYSQYNLAFERFHRTIKARNVVKEYNKMFVGDYESMSKICKEFYEMPMEIDSTKLKLKYDE